MEPKSNNSINRNKVIIRTGAIGITANVFLAGFKAFVGIVSNSVAITMDAVNNISDAASSVITIVGIKLAGKSPNKKHPFGYGRVEYLSELIISMLVLYAGITALIQCIKKLINPVLPDYSALSLVIVAVAVVVKIVLGLYVRKTGEKVRSDSLIDSGKDALLDSVISTATLVAALIYKLFNISLEAWLGAAIAAVIIKSGLGMMRETLSRILGERADEDLAKEIKSIIMSYPDVSGVYDLIMHNYGPDKFHASVHIELPDTYTADMIDRLIREISVDVYKQLSVILTAVGVYSVNTKDPGVASAREKVYEIASSVDNVLQVHGFYMNEKEKTIRFDVLVGFDAKDRHDVYNEVCEKVQAAFPDYTLQVFMDADFSESE